MTSRTGSLRTYLEAKVGSRLAIFVSVRFTWSRSLSSSCLASSMPDLNESTRPCAAFFSSVICFSSFVALSTSAFHFSNFWRSSSTSCP